MNERINTLLQEAGLPPAEQVERVSGGGNNRAYRVRTGTRTVFAKEYFVHPFDRRDRGRTEYEFLRFAWDNGIRCVPEPIAYSPAENVAIYSYVEGRRLEPAQLSEAHLAQASAFFLELNRHRDGADAAALRPGSEACFSTSDHLACVERRVTRLLSALSVAKGDAESDALAFVRDELIPRWNKVSKALAQRWDRALDPGERCLSPSDFGFHNALCGPGEHLYFLDFEYAGWDDPAKLVCDFFCQPGVPVPMEHFETFSTAVQSALSLSPQHRERIRELFPLYQIKWCCIMLNHFLPVEMSRRQFAAGSGESERGEAERAKGAQVAKARRAAERIVMQG